MQVMRGQGRGAHLANVGWEYELEYQDAFGLTAKSRTIRNWCVDDGGASLSQTTIGKLIHGETVR